MYKVLIVDDEYYVITLIRHLVNWQELGMEVVGEASDGIEALEKIQTCQPDIVVVDICMPEIDGITLIQQIREINKKLRFIVISGHQKFEYAKSVIQYNVEDYLLKPIDKEELEAILLRVKGRLEQEHTKQQEQEKKDRKLLTTTQQLREYFLTLLRERKINWSYENEQVMQEKYHLDFSYTFYRFVLLELHIKEVRMNVELAEDSLNEIQTYLESALVNLPFKMIFTKQKTQILCMLNYDATKKESTLEAFHLWKEELDYRFRKFQAVYLTIVVGEEFCDWQKCYKELDTVEGALKAKILLGCGRLYKASLLRRQAGRPRVVIDTAQAEALQSYMEDWNENKIKMFLSNQLYGAENYKEEDSLILHQVSLDILRIFYSYLQKSEAYHEEFEELEALWEQHFARCTSISDIKNHLYQLFEEYTKCYLLEGQAGENPAIRRAKKYIAKHYSEEITLARVAQEVNLSRVYFSILFKKETGRNFQEYVSSYRVDIAKELLKNIQYNINEIAEKAGFREGRYFSKVFKKLVGITPGEYRKRHMD